MALVLRFFGIGIGIWHYWILVFRGGPNSVRKVLDFGLERRPNSVRKVLEIGFESCSNAVRKNFGGRS